MDRVVLWGILAAFTASAGCAHNHLSWNTVRQSKTLSDIYEQQVLDNLAKFVVDPAALPFFAYPNQGGSDVTDDINIGNDITWDRLGFASDVLSLSGRRGATEAWTLTPVHDVRRLELMRCAYQQALICAGIVTNLPTCPDCDKLQRAFYTGDPTSPDDIFEFSAKTGRTTPACFQHVRWIEIGDKSCLPNNHECLKVGHYCGTYVWVLPGGQDELTKLTLTILDYAFSPQATLAPPATKEVVIYLDANGIPTSNEKAVQVIRAIVPFDKPVRLRPPSVVQEEGLTAEQQKTAARQAQELEQRGGAVDAIFQPDEAPRYDPAPILPPPMPLSPLQLELNRQFLAPQIR